MRTIVELPDNQIDHLKTLGKRLGLPRTELVRRAVADYLARHPTEPKDAAFGLWKERSLPDGLAWQQRMRTEWDE
jgi:metal-responsive CopG/Arc/MetJ family transcriptional regulator